ncbi:MAG: cell division protease FtsH [Solirubrobacteraceae bacterium]|nr:cell division protease FtsH [Solirubrobacteraceae bacterium]
MSDAQRSGKQQQRSSGRLASGRRHAARLWAGLSRTHRVMLGLVVLAALAIGAPHAISLASPAPPPPASTFSGVLGRIDAGKVAEVRVDGQALSVRVTERDRSVPAYSVGLPGIAGNELLLERARRRGVQVDAVAASGSGLAGILRPAIPMLLMVALIVFVLRRQGLVGGRSFDRAERPDVAFADVAGVGEAVEELQDVRAFLEDPERFERLGARVPKGVLLYGRPGTGKTLLAKAVAAEAGVPFYAVSGSDFVQMFAGLGAARIRSLFSEAKKNAPAIVFIDELDSAGRTRGAGNDGGTREADQTLTQLLTEMDGFTPSRHPVIVMAATNHPEALDPALTRPGRFDRHVSIDPPDRAGRRAILDVHAAEKRLGQDVDLHRLAEQTAGMTGAELANVLNETVLQAARRGADEATAADLEDAFMRVVAGAAKQNRAMSDADRTAVAWHEAGHAIVGERLAAADKVHKISIIPRGRSGGQTILVSEEDVFLHGESDLRDRIAWTLAGRAAERIALGRITTGAADDLQRTTDLAMQLCARFGMGGALGLRVATDEHPLSPELQARLDGEVRSILDEEFARAMAMLADERDALTRVTETLLAEETVDRDRFLALLERPVA